MGAVQELVSADMAGRRVLRELCATCCGAIFCSEGVVFGSNCIVALVVQDAQIVPCSFRK